MKDYLEQWESSTQDEKIRLCDNTPLIIMMEFIDYLILPKPPPSHLTETDPIKHALLLQLQASIHATTELVFAHTRTLTDLFVECETIEDYVKITKQLKESLDATST